MRTLNGEKYWVEQWASLHRHIQDVRELYEMAKEETDEEALREVADEVGTLDKQLRALEVQNMLGDTDDNRDAILTIHPGAGGTESQDWAEMLLRMYVRWIERHQFDAAILDRQDGEEAGIKSATIEVKGPFAFGLLKAEIGVHRLVRISPFDSNKRRHTSFASLFVYPEVDDTVPIEINPNDLRIDTYRASGAGGQHVNKTDSAVRITHEPTGIVVQCQNERSQHKNKANAMKILKARLYQLKREEESERKAELEQSKKEIAWGSQIRSYVMHPYNMVKDHRTKMETSDVERIMEGDLDEFIEAYLMQQSNASKSTA